MTPTRWLGVVGPAVALVVVAAACSVARDTGGVSDGDCSAAPPAGLRAEVLRELPHDPDAYTQGLVMTAGDLWESTGRRGESDLRRVDVDSGEVLTRAPLDDHLFAEGLAVGQGGELVQLTWTSEVALRWDPTVPATTGSFSYDGEGWGLSTLDDGDLVMSDGSDVLAVRDPGSFSVVREIRVEREGGGADDLNELEWDGSRLWANRYQTDEILRIDLDCGVVDAVVDGSPLTERAEELIVERGLDRDTSLTDVLNGIAWLGPTAPDTYLVTGKRWPVVFEVEFVPTG